LVLVKVPVLVLSGGTLIGIGKSEARVRIEIEVVMAAAGPAVLRQLRKEGRRLR
jgi:hypothetical protein